MLDAKRITHRTDETAPPHPGEYLREDILPALNMTITELAKRLEHVCISLNRQGFTTGREYDS